MDTLLILWHEHNLLKIRFTRLFVFSAALTLFMAEENITLLRGAGVRVHLFLICRKHKLLAAASSSAKSTSCHYD